MRYVPYPFQEVGIEHAVDFLSKAKQDERLLYAAPTGCGKSVVELSVQERLPGTWIISPREEIIDGMLDKLESSEDMLHHSICTPIRFRNLLLQGKIPHPRALIIDEGHHHNAETYQQLDLLTGMCPSIAYTATPYRGSPRGTKELLARWGDPLWLITYSEAAEQGYVSVPSFEMLPLVDDDIVEVKGGEFDVTSIEAATMDRLGDMAEHCKKWYTNSRWDRPTVFAMPSTAACVRLQAELLRRGILCSTINAATPKSDRRQLFQACVDRLLAVLHINIVSEGVDLPVRRVVDMAPTLSPVKWVQQLGRATRPVWKRCRACGICVPRVWEKCSCGGELELDIQPAYVCTNRNLLRHAYALEGVVPVAAVVDAEKSFPPSERPHTRVLGLEAIGRFKPANTKLLSGLNVSTYSLSVVNGGVVVEYCCLVHPAMDPVWASKINTIVDGVKQWGSWAKCDPPEDLRGFSSVPPNPPTEKQLAWWNRSAARFGIDPSQEVNRKSFQALPVLADLGVRLR